ncbi:3-oxoacyl-[acyl-carrier-protein] reductase FabG [Devosia equisanguinis]|uniref:3-oxoacyl-[acyl-carrier-protein] reductase FabG n=1 Tax=Devosia equisanguinis TaxID=2490941 RepID=A0A447I6I3_9HYPH|nr:3-oxoacyl-ACP reductase family protein [Devosia equisanguinis]VDS03012.1 3-oxoacyl-[acyl-carrier-protein] reductase FabG [Devosia equisanguinis]
MLKGKVALVTGAGRGIGNAVARGLAKRGATLAVNDLDGNTAAAAAAEIGNGAIAVAGDVSDEAVVKSMIETTLTKLGRIDILVNNAGIDRAASIVDISVDEWDRFIAVNLRSVFLCSRTVLPHMRERGSGSIVNLSSIVGRQGALNGGIHYATTKAGILGFTRTLARQTATQGITVNAVAPGVIDTDLIRENVTPEARDRLTSAIPKQRLGETDEVANAIAFLASEEARYITGATLDVNGGFWMG